jgi:hypothetical protein
MAREIKLIFKKGGYTAPDRLIRPWTGEEENRSSKSKLLKDPRDLVDGIVPDDHITGELHPF